MATGRYAVISIVRKQVADFTDRPQMFNQQYNLLVDLTEHPQKEDVDIDWFYNSSTNTFSESDEIELLSLSLEETTETNNDKSQLSEEEKMLLITSVNSDYLVCLADLNL